MLVICMVCVPVKVVVDVSCGYTDNTNDVDAIINEPSVTSDGTGAISGIFHWKHSL